MPVDGRPQRTHRIVGVHRTETFEADLTVKFRKHLVELFRLVQLIAGRPCMLSIEANVQPFATDFLNDRPELREL